MSKKVIRIPITNIYAGGDYTGLIYVGSKRKPANVLLDTGSSTLAIEESVYNPARDPKAQITDMIQEVSYTDRTGWIGSVVKADISIGSGKTGSILPKVNVAVAYSATKGMFSGVYDGMLGLAYSRLNNAYVLPGKTFPARYNYNEIQRSRQTFIKPYFSQLEDAGVVADKFAFYTLRSVPRREKSDISKDLLNNGFLILGGGEESRDLYKGSFKNIRVLDDHWYNTNLLAVVVGTNPPIEAHSVTKGSGNITNSIIDSGTNSIYLPQYLFNSIADDLGPKLGEVMKQGEMPLGDFNPEAWPDISFMLEGEDDTAVTLTMKPSTYWQTFTEERGLTMCAIGGDQGTLKGQAILGLPLMNNYFTIFDRSAGKGMGIIKCAPIRNP